MRRRNGAYRAERFEDALALESHLGDAEVRRSLTQNTPAASIFASSIAGAYLAIDTPLRAFAYRCQAQAISPTDACRRTGKFARLRTGNFAHSP